MPIKNIKVSNFKSFKNIDVDLHNLNILIGANASGKSNFVSIFRFLSDFRDHGLENAISLQGGVEYLRNIKIGSNELLSIDIEYNTQFERTVKDIVVRFKNIQYRIEIKFSKTRSTFCLEKERFLIDCEFFSFDLDKEKIVEKESLGTGKINLTAKRKDIETSIEKPDSIDINVENLIPPYSFFQESHAGNVPLLNSFSFFFMPFDFINDVSIYDFDPKLPKKAVTITGKAELEEDGSNLALVLKKIKENNEELRKFSNLIQDILPFIDGIGFDRFADKSLLFKLKENYFDKKFMPASLVSDGTINIAALIVALYFGRKSLTIIEEPERNVHPGLISKMLNLMKDASKNRQIVVTTHNPELVKHADLDDLLFVSRCKEGFSTISRPSENKDIDHFLKNDIGLDEIMVQNLWGI